jgi:hypothetical protein
MAADIDVRVIDAAWEGLGAGHGFLRARTLTVEATGRRGAARARQLDVQLPDPQGGLTVVPVVEEPLDSEVPQRPRLTVVAS